MTGAELAILGLIAERASHAYELEQIIERRDMRQWTEIGFSSIYYLLKKFEKAGWVRSRLDGENQQGPAQRIYELTPEGYAVWHAALVDTLATPHQHFDPFQLGLANLPALSKAEALAALHTRRARLNQTLEHVRARRMATQSQAAPHVDSMFDLSITLLEAETQWLDRFIDDLSHSNQGADHHDYEIGPEN